MSLIRTFTVTVAGGKFVIDGVSQDTVTLAEGYTYKFDQADASNGAGGSHPLRFSTNNDNSPSAPYTTGVTTAGSPGSAGAYTQIEVADSAPKLYYYCTNHSGMGGTANTEPSDTWGLLQWSQNAWGNQDEMSVTLTGLSATSSVNLPAENVTMFPGWGTQSWGDNSWGDVTGHTFTLTAPTALTSSTGALAPEDVLGITGVSATASVNSFALVSTDATFTLSGLSADVSEGLFVLDDHSVGLGQLSATVTVGALDPDDLSLGITGIQAQTTIGSVSISSEPVILLTAPTGLTSTLGTVTSDPVTSVTLSGLSGTMAQGTLTTIQVSNAILTGLVATTTLNNPATTGYKNIVIEGNTSYSDVDITGNTSYTDVKHVNQA